MPDRAEIAFSRALVLGATGMIGAHAVRECLRRRIRVRALVRAGSDRRNLDGLEIEMATGDLADLPSLRRALRGCDLLIHAAAPYPTRHFGKARFLARARTGLANLLEAAIGAATMAGGEVPGDGTRRILKRMVYVSSATTVGIPAGEDGRPAPHSRPARESDDRFPVRDDSPYFAVKFTMEKMVLDATRAGLPTVTVNPTFCVDEFDSHGTTGQLMIPLARRQIPAYIPGHLNAVATRDVGEGILLAAGRGRAGSGNSRGADNRTRRYFGGRGPTTAGVPAPRLAAPMGVAEALGLLTEICAQITHTRPLFPMAGIRMMKHSQAYDTARARDELGFRPTSVDEAIGRAYNWYRAQGML